MILMMKKKIKSDLEELSCFVLNSSNDSDYVTRFNFLLSVFCNEFESDINKEDFLPFFSHELINEYNSTFNAIIRKLNKETTNENLHLKNDIFIFILREDYNAYYNLWLCKRESACN